jgi:hypothetical protein
MARRSLCSRRLTRAATLSGPAVGLLLAACASFQDTPAQDLAWSRWTACRVQITGVEVRTVDLGGRITFWADGTGDGFAMLDCLRQAPEGGPTLPEAIFEVRPKGGS